MRVLCPQGACCPQLSDPRHAVQEWGARLRPSGQPVAYGLWAEPSTAPPQVCLMPLLESLWSVSESSRFPILSSPF